MLRKLTEDGAHESQPCLLQMDQSLVVQLMVCGILTVYNPLISCEHLFSVIYAYLKLVEIS